MSADNFVADSFVASILQLAPHHIYGDTVSVELPGDKNSRRNVRLRLCVPGLDLDESANISHVRGNISSGLAIVFYNYGICLKEESSIRKFRSSIYSEKETLIFYINCRRTRKKRIQF